MSGEFLNITHRCVLPEIEPHYGPDTVWRCECEQFWRTGYDNSLNLEWQFLHKHLWNEQEKRVKTYEELIIPTNVQSSQRKKPRFMDWR